MNMQPDPYLDPRGYVEWVKNNPNATMAEKERSDIMQALNYNVPVNVTQEQIKQALETKAVAAKVEEKPEVTPKQTEIKQYTEEQRWYIDQARQFGGKSAAEAMRQEFERTQTPEFKENQAAYAPSTEITLTDKAKQWMAEHQIPVSLTRAQKIALNKLAANNQLKLAIDIINTNRQLETLVHQVQEVETQREIDRIRAETIQTLEPIMLEMERAANQKRADDIREANKALEPLFLQMEQSWLSRESEQARQRLDSLIVAAGGPTKETPVSASSDQVTVLANPQEASNLIRNWSQKPEFSWKATKEVGIISAELIIPGVYTGRHWNEMSTSSKTLSIALDVVSLIPFATGATQGARGVATAGRLARITGAVKGFGRAGIETIRGPVDMVIHPVSTVKGTLKTGRNIIEVITHPKRIPEMVVGITDTTVRLRVGETTSPEQAMKIRDILMSEAVRTGKPVYIEYKGQKVYLERSQIMRELGGGATHASPSSVPFKEPLEVLPNVGKTEAEQGLFVSHEPLPRFAEAAAFPSTSGSVRQLLREGRYTIPQIADKLDLPVKDVQEAVDGLLAGKEIELLKSGKYHIVQGNTPVIYIMSPETAAKTVSSEKLYKSPYGAVAEMERKLPVGYKTTGPKQILWTRIGDGTKTAIFLEKPLKPYQIAKLKALGVVEMVKAPFKPAILVKGKGAITVLKDSEMFEVERILRRSGNIAEAGNMARARVIYQNRGIGRDTRTPEIPRRTPPRLERITGLDVRLPEVRARVDSTRVERVPIPRAERLSIPERQNREIPGREGERITVDREVSRTETGRDETSPPDERETTRIEPPRIEPPRVSPPRTEPPRIPPERPPDRPPVERPPTRRPPEYPPDRPPVRQPPPKLPPTRPPNERPPNGSPDSRDQEKRDLLSTKQGLVARRRGELRGYSIWRVRYYPYGENDKLVLFGDPPTGAIPASGPGSVAASATLVYGIPPSKPILDDTGAVDDIIYPIITKEGGKNKILVRSVKDTTVSKPRPVTIHHYHPKRQKGEVLPTRDLGGGIEQTAKGRHIRL